MNFIEGRSRREVALMPACVDDYVSSDNPVRDLDSFVDSLDLHALGFIFPKSDLLGRGRPAFHPKVLLKLFIYGYQNNLRSGRKLAKSCLINLEVMWLVESLTPDFKTICDFRKNNSEAFIKVASEYSVYCLQEGYIDGKLLAVDGSRIKGQNNPDKSWTVSKIEKLHTHLEKEIGNYLQAIEDADECPAPSDDKLKEHTKTRVEHLRNRQDELVEKRKEMTESGEASLSESDPDTRILNKNGNRVVGYNAQTVVDSKHGLIVCSEVTNNHNDIGLLSPMTNNAMETLGLDEVEVVADKGYYSAEDLKNCEESNITAHVPEVKMSPSERQGLFGKRHFEYIEEKNVYICPANNELVPPKKKKEKAKSWNYRNRKACENCPLKSRCTTGKYRSIKRTVNDQYLERNRQRLSHNKEIRRRRKAIAEPPFSWLKLQSLVGGFQTKGLTMVNAEFSLAQIAFNMKRVTSIKAKKAPSPRSILAMKKKFFVEMAYREQLLAA